MYNEAIIKDTKRALLKGSSFEMSYVSDYYETVTQLHGVQTLTMPCNVLY